MHDAVELAWKKVLCSVYAAHLLYVCTWCVQDIVTRYILDIVFGVRGCLAMLHPAITHYYQG